MNEKQFDELLSNLQKQSRPEFQPVQDFKKTFFAKAEKLPNTRRRLLPWLGGIAALLILSVGIMYEMETDKSLNSYRAAQKMDLSVSQEVECSAEPVSIPCAVQALSTKEVSSSDMAGRFALKRATLNGVAMPKTKVRVRMSCEESLQDWGLSMNSIPCAPLPESHESYRKITENSWQSALKDPTSTFSANVDATSYANIRRMLNANQLPSPDAVRIEEMINYFSYDYAHPTGDTPVAVSAETGVCPWSESDRLIRIGLRSKDLPTAALPASNLVFLIDVSGSMDMPNKLPLLKSAFKLLVEQLRPVDRVAIVVYAGAAGVVLPSTSAHDKSQIFAALEQLESGGSTAGAEGINLAYKLAQENFAPGGNNRVILATDGDFNVGPASDADLVRIVEEKRKSGIFLTVLGFGMGNYKDAKIEQLAQNGNGNSAYIDTLLEAKKVLVKEFCSTLFTVAKDVKLQIEFNPAKVDSYRLIGFENRMLSREDFSDDKKDAGEMGVGHSVTAIYQITPVKERAPHRDDLRYIETRVRENAVNCGEIAVVKVRCKTPDSEVSQEFQFPVIDNALRFSENSDDFRFAVGVAGFGQLLRGSEHKGNLTYPQVTEILRAAKGKDLEGYRAELVRLTELAQLLQAKKK